MKVAIAIDGGGMKGAIPAAILTEIEKRAGRPVSVIADLIGGTSTGGILSVGLGLGIAGSKLSDLYMTEGPAIFHRSLLDRVARNALLLPKYSGAGREGVLRKYFGERTLGSARTRVMATAYDIRHGNPRVFKSWLPVDGLWESWWVAMCTSAAPIYFDPVDGCYVDGGVFANDPAMPVYAEAKALWPNEPILLLSIGCGAPARLQLTQGSGGWGLARWLKAGLVTVLMDGPMQSDRYMLKSLTAAAGDTYVRIEPPSGNAPSAMDDTSPGAMQARHAAALAWIAANSSQLDALIASFPN